MGSPAGIPPRQSPFGYNIEDSLMTPPPPQGNPILGTSENHILGNFFTHLQQNEWAMMRYNDTPDFSDHWVDGGAPNLLAHASCFAPQPPPESAVMTGLLPASLQDGFTFVPNVMSPQAPPPIRQQPLHQPQTQPQPQSQPQPQLNPTHFHQQPQPYHDQRFFGLPAEQDAHTDAAASLTTLQSGHTNAYSSRMTNLNRLHSSPNAQALRSYRNSLSQPHPIQSHSGPMRPVISNEHDTTFQEMVFGSQGATVQRIAERPELQWGSDTLFSRNQGFVPPQNESSEALENKRMVTMEALKLSSSNPDTRASSPIGKKEAAISAVSENPNGNNKVEEIPATPNKRRRKSKAKIEGGEDGEHEAPPPKKTMARKRKSGGDLTESDDLSSMVLVEATTGRRRKSAPQQAKQPRENLTLEQKRENHIKSEKKRRGYIKEGFADLNAIVPNAQNASYSKSTVLNMAKEWIESLIQGNQILDPEGKTTP
ncbi:hypothetical protein F5Y12DRAFT_97225 [Xylaria sp. FL1777]|nr:hypothetical protein F5Y12DRAFT_97225 [Xylaria sp. FL1777]